MTLDALKRELAANLNWNIRFVLPDGRQIPIHAHVTEVARIDKKFVDCGGTFRSSSYCRLQTWLAQDLDHRLSAGKLLGILNKASSFLESEDLEVDVEHELDVITQFPLESVQVSLDALLLRLGTRHTACLAPETCLPPRTTPTAIRFKPLPNITRPPQIK